MRRFLLLMVIPFLSLGCATITEPKPGTITLEDALKSVGKGLVLMKKAELEENDNKEFKSGLMPSEAEVVFNISASRSSDGKLYVELTPVSVSPVQGKAGGSIGTSESLTRGNQITIKFRNIAFSKTTTTSKDGQSVTIDGITDAKKLTAFLKAAEGNYLPPMSKPGTGAQTGNNNNSSSNNNSNTGGLTIMSIPVPASPFIFSIIKRNRIKNAEESILTTGGIMNFWMLVFIVSIAGGIGGCINALLTQNGFILPKVVVIDPDTKLIRLGCLNNILIGAAAAVVSWGLYGPLANYFIIGTSEALKQNQPSGYGLTLGAFVGAALVGTAGARWFTNEVDKTLLKASVVKAAGGKPSPEASRKIAAANPMQIFSIAKEL